MARYRFVTRWTLPASPERVYDLLSDTDRLVAIWPSLYKSARVTREGSPEAGKTVEAVTRGFLPYDIHWRFVVTEAKRPTGFSISADGDLVGNGVWRFSPVAGGTDVEYVWEVVAEKPLLKIFSPILRPLFAWNHDWVMRKGEEALKAELMKR